MGAGAFAAAAVWAVILDGRGGGVAADDGAWCIVLRLAGAGDSGGDMGYVADCIDHANRRG